MGRLAELAQQRAEECAVEAAERERQRAEVIRAINANGRQRAIERLLSFVPKEDHEAVRQSITEDENSECVLCEGVEFFSSNAVLKARRKCEKCGETVRSTGCFNDLNDLHELLHFPHTCPVERVTDIEVPCTAETPCAGPTTAERLVSALRDFFDERY